MIEFACGSCGKKFSVPGTYAGRKARCKSCGGMVSVPAPPRPEPIPAPAPAESRLPVRTRRLMAEAQEVASAFAGFPLIRVVPSAGNPPEVYEVEYAVNGMAPGETEEPIPQGLHRVRIELTSEYPRQSPLCKMLTPAFHPNIDETTICVGDHWTAGERLVDLVIRIGEMLAYQDYNIKSPLNGVAAMWADLHPQKLPTDTADLHPPGLA